MHRVTIGYSFRRESIDEISRRRQGFRFTLPECDRPRRRSRAVLPGVVMVCSVVSDRTRS